MKTIHFPTELWVGEGALANLETLHDRRVFIVTDPFMVDSGFVNEVTKHLTKSEWQIFSDIIPDPPIDKIAAGIKQLAAFQGDTILALGGGSAIDAAKAMKFFGKRTLQTQIAEFIAVPTTSGTGSEVTNFSVITVAETGTKIPLVTDEIQPEIAILDTNLVMSVPPKITADTGMDVLTHVIEAYVSTEANPISDALCEKVVRLVFDNLEIAFNEGSNQQARENMHLASYNSGLANGKVTNEPTAKHYAQLANCLNDTQTTNARIGVQQFIRQIKQLRQKLNMPATFSDYGLPKEEVQAAIPKIAEGALMDGCTKTNPVQPTAAEVTKILNSIL